MTLIYDSMRVRDDLRENGDNVFWVKEEDYLKVKAVNQKLYEALVHALEHHERMNLPLVVQDKMIKAVKEAEKA